MYTTYHLTSAQEVSTDILHAIKATFKSKPITIIVEEDDSDFELTADMKAVLDEIKGDVALHVEANNPAKHLYESLGFTNPYLEMRLKRN